MNACYQESMGQGDDTNDAPKPELPSDKPNDVVNRNSERGYKSEYKQTRPTAF